MLGSNLFSIPADQVASLVPDLEYFDEHFSSVSVEALDFGYWELFSSELAAVSVIGEVYFTGESEGWFIFEWAPAFTEALVNASQASLQAVIQKLLPESSSGCLTEAGVLQECEKVIAFVKQARSDAATVVEVAAS